MYRGEPGALPPYCGGCGIIVERLGIFCAECQSKYGIENDECVCYLDCPDDCSARIDHWCCCTNQQSTNVCRALESKHDCCCMDQNVSDCRATDPDHNCVCLEKDASECRALGHRR